MLGRTLHSKTRRKISISWEAAFKNELGSKIKLDRQFHEKSTELEKLLAKKRETEHLWGVVRKKKVEHMHSEEKRNDV